MNKMYSEPRRFITVVVKCRQSVYLKLPIEVIPPVRTDLLKETTVEPVLPRARGIVGPANSAEPVLKVFEVGLVERDRKRHHPAGASWFHNCLPLLMRFPFSLAKWPLSRSCTAAFGLSRLNPSAPAGIKNGSNRPQIANSGGFDLRKYSWKSLQGC